MSIFIIWVQVSCLFIIYRQSAKGSTLVRNYIKNVCFAGFMNDIYSFYQCVK